ncbi:hypothetical protein F5884DRAFT_295548 [Xylogone sp. PMI_703]|nr:hypothetical protein F5884DRAFT_295548 [Xylogone sp. PMI_703]
MSFLNTTFQTLNIKTLPSHISRDQVVRLLHNHHKMITMNPLVTDYFAHPEDVARDFFKNEHPDHRPPRELFVPVYAITDDMSGPPKRAQSTDEDSSSVGGGSRGGGWAKKFTPDKITYHASMQNRPDGLLTITHAPMGVHSITTWLVKETYDGQLVLEEKGLVTSNRMLMGLIKSTLQSSHDKLVEDFIAELVKEAERENQMRAKEGARHGRAPSRDNLRQSEKWEARYSRDMGKPWI